MKLTVLCLLIRITSVIGGRDGTPMNRVVVARNAHNDGDLHPGTSSENVEYGYQPDVRGLQQWAHHTEYEYVGAEPDEPNIANRYSSTGHSSSYSGKGRYSSNGNGYVKSSKGGKGSKGAKGSKVSKGKRGTKGSKGSSSSRGSSSSKGTKGSKGSKGGSGDKGKDGYWYGKGDYYHPHPSSSPTAANDESDSGDYYDYGDGRPQIPVSPPTEVPVSEPVQEPDQPRNSLTTSPTDGDSIAVDLSPFSLVYQTETKRQATRNELAELTDVTRLHLERFMFSEVETSSFTFLDDFITRMITSTFISGFAPYIVDYGATARFNPFSTVFLSQEQLDEGVEIAFTRRNLDEYESRLAGLPQSNVFRGAQVSFGNQPLPPVSERSSNNAAVIAAAAVAATLLAAGLVLYKRRRDLKEELDSELKGKGDSTVAGETFTGETYDGTASVGSGSLGNGTKYKDNVDGGAKQCHDVLGTIDEDEDDADSVPSNWKNKQQYDVEEARDLFFQTQSHGERPITRNPSVNSAFSEETGTETGALEQVSTEDDDRNIVDQGSASTGQTELFDQMALQGLGSLKCNAMSDEDSDSENDNVEDQDEFLDEPSLPSNGDLNLASPNSFSSSTSASRPRTVAEIEAMLTADNEEDFDEEDTQSDSQRSHSFGADNATVKSSLSQRPRTVEEIESLLSMGMDDDHSETSSLVQLD